MSEFINIPLFTTLHVKSSQKRALLTRLTHVKYLSKAQSVQRNSQSIIICSKSFKQNKRAVIGSFTLLIHVI
jgi:hypothetical protein